MKTATILDSVDVVIAAGVVLIILKSVITDSWFFTGGILASSVVAPMLSVLIVSRALKDRGLSIERFFIGLTAAVSGIWLYEILYHYGFLTTVPYILDNVQTFNIDTGLGTYFPLSWALIMVSLPFVAYKHMSINKVFVLCGVSTFVLFGLWISMGYPQWMYPGSFFTNRLILVSPASAVAYGLFFNTVTKAVVILIPCSLFYRKGLHFSNRFRGGTHRVRQLTRALSG
jgi:hypothetical protein